MPPKNKPNGFFMYMKEQQAILKSQGIHHSMREMPSVCRQQWNNMSGDQRIAYDKKAKMAKRETSGQEAYGRKDNQRQLIAERKDPVKEMKKRRAAENQLIRSLWKGQDLKNMKIYLIHFQVMYIDWQSTHRMPMEIGMVCITMNGGIERELHRFINPGDAPEGYRSMAMDHAEKTHQIPINFKDGDTNFRGLCQQIEEFVRKDSECDETPPIFCLSTERYDAEVCLEFLYDYAHLPFENRLTRIYCLEDLAASFVVMTQQGPEPSETQLLDALQQNRWDYMSEIRCSYHEEQDCAHCSLSKVKRYSFALFDTLAKVMHFDLTKKHMPDETDIINIVVHHPPPKVHNSRHRMGRAGDHASYDVRHNMSNLSLNSSGDRQRSPHQSDRFDRFEDRYDRYQGQPVPPVVGRVEIQLDEDDSDEEDVLQTDEVRSTEHKYKLKELRLPKTVSMAAAAVTAIQPGDIPAGRPQQPAAVPGAGLRMPSALAIGRGRGVSPLVRPPPGFSATPMPRAPAPAWGPTATTPTPEGSVWGGSSTSGASSTSGGESLSLREAPQSLTPAMGGVAVGRGVMMGRGRAPSVAASTPSHLQQQQGAWGTRPALPMGRGRAMPMGRGYSS